MKKVLAIISVCALLLTLCSCQKNDDVSLLLSGEKTFTDFETQRTATIFTLPDENTSYLGKPASYAVIDLDDNGKNELLIEYDGAGDTAVLTLRDGEYIAYYISYRARTDLKEDGTMSYSSGASDSGVQRLTFTDDGMESINVLEYNTGDYIFTIDGKKVSEEECAEALRKQYDKKEVVWNPIGDASVLEEDNENTKETGTITVEEFGNIANGVWVNLDNPDGGYECVHIAYEGDTWRYKYGIYETDNAYNMEISEVNIKNDAYKLTLYSPGGYNEMYDIYEEEEYRYVDVKIVDEVMTLDGLNRVEYQHFFDFSDLNNYLKKSVQPTLFGFGDSIKYAVNDYFSYAGINASTESYNVKNYEVKDMSGTDAVYEDLISCTYGPNDAIGLMGYANDGKVDYVYTFMPLAGANVSGETLATIATMEMIPAGIFNEKYSSFESLYNFMEELIQNGTRDEEGDSMSLVIDDVKYTLTVSDILVSFLIEVI